MVVVVVVEAWEEGIALWEEEMGRFLLYVDFFGGFGLGGLF